MYTAVPMQQFVPFVPLVRRPTVRQVPLTPQGNLVVDVPVPDFLMRFRQGPEFSHLRYSAVTCDPDDFGRRGFTLRQQEYGRPTELFVVVTMYNEDEFLLTKTLTSIFKNIQYLCSRNRSKTWGAEGWQKVVVCIVSDGRNKINSRSLAVLGAMGVYQDGVMKNSVAGQDVTGHVFEYTTQICVDTNQKIKGPESNFVPVQLIFCLKEKNQKKINSHRWFFNAFAPLLRPNVCLLIDVGTKPSPTSFYHLWKAFDRDPNVGGACGEIYVETGTMGKNLINPLVAAQNFEYKMSNILDKPLESVFGFISVLPGAFSAYRYLAIRGAPLEAYFKGETMHGTGNVFAANMYLAEDRILCFEVVNKANENWVLRYVSAAKAETDVPDGVPEFISQRRRWLNGSFFAAIYALFNWAFLFRSSHSIFRKLILFLQVIYNFYNLVFNWFSVANFYLTFYFLASSSDGPLAGASNIVFTLLSHLYVAALVMILISCLGNRPQGSKWLYTFCMFLFAGIMGVLLFLSGFIVYQTVKSFTDWNNPSIIFSRPALRDILISSGSTYGLYFVASIVYLDPWHLITSFIQYLFILPSFINILMTYSFCNLHDVTWGTKGDNGSAGDLGSVKITQDKDGQQTAAIQMPTDRNDINTNYEKFMREVRSPKLIESSKRDAKTKQDDYFRNFRTRVVLFWVFTNATLVILLTSTLSSNFLYSALGVSSSSGSGFNPYLRFIMYSVAGISAVRFTGSMLYLLGKLISC